MSTPSIGIWTEHRNPEGRTYWFNTATKQSVWEKPDDLKTPFERALNSQTKWKEYFSGGRKYYYNTESKESKWDMPDELLLLLEQVEKEQHIVTATSRGIAAPPVTPATGAVQGGITPVGGVNPSSSSSQPSQNGTSLAVGAHTGGLPLSTSSVLPPRPNLPDDPVIPHNGFQTVEEGEKAFMHLLKKAGVDANWTWDQTMRAIITDPLYKSLNTLAEKKACWEKYTTSLRVKDHEEREARLNKLRPAIRNMLKGNPNVFHYTTFPTADKLFAQHPIWQQAKIEAERRLIFEEHVDELKEREVAETRASRVRSVSKVVSLFKQLNVDVVTRWRQAHEQLMESEDWQNDSELRKLPTLDILLAFEDYSRVREREYEEQMRKTQVDKVRRERKAREAFKALLQDLVGSGKIKARTKWKEIYPTFRDDKRYLDMLGNPGSNPLELFWDVVDILDQKLDAKVVIIEDVIKRHNAQKAAQVPREPGEDPMEVDAFTVTPETTWEQFLSVVNPEGDTGLSQEDLEIIFKALHQDSVKKQAEEKRRHEKRQRHLQDDLRYALKKLAEPIDLNMRYEDAVPLIRDLPEYKALEDEGRRVAFAKFVKRQKEKLRETNSEDGGSATSRKRKDPPREYRDEERGRDKERERERERERSSHRERDGHRERERERERDRGKDYDRGGRSSRHHRYDEEETRRSGRDYDREKDRDGYKSSKYHRDDDKRKDKEVEKDKDRRGERGTSRGHEWEEGARRGDRERSGSFYQENSRDKRDHEEPTTVERPEKRARYEREDEAMEVDKKVNSVREETPEEGEI